MKKTSGFWLLLAAIFLTAQVFARNVGGSESPITAFEKANLKKTLAPSPFLEGDFHDALSLKMMLAMSEALKEAPYDPYYAHVVHPESLNTDYFKSKTTGGNWTASGTWTSCATAGGTYVNATIAPDFHAAHITVVATSVVTSNASTVTMSGVTVELGGRIIVNSNGRYNPTQNCDISGTLDFQPGTTATYSTLVSIPTGVTTTAKANTGVISVGTGGTLAAGWSVLGDDVTGSTAWKYENKAQFYYNSSFKLDDNNTRYFLSSGSGVNPILFIQKSGPLGTTTGLTIQVNGSVVVASALTISNGLAFNCRNGLTYTGVITFPTPGAITTGDPLGTAQVATLTGGGKIATTTGVSTLTILSNCTTTPGSDGLLDGIDMQIAGTYDAGDTWVIDGTGAKFTANVQVGGLCRTAKTDGMWPGSFTTNCTSFTCATTGAMGTIEYYSPVTDQYVSSLIVHGNLLTSGTGTPRLDGNTIVMGTTTVGSTGSLVLNGKSLEQHGAFITGSFLKGSSSSGLIFAGNVGTVNFNQGGATSNYLKTLTGNSGSATLGNRLNIVAGPSFGTVTVNSGATLNANSNLTLKSDVNGTARIANSAGTITGNATPEHFIPPIRAWRFLVPSIGGTQTINAAWMEGATPFPSYYTSGYQNSTYNPKPGFGMDITYLHADQSNGFDENTTENPSLKVWNQATSTWVSPTSTYVSINTYPAYCPFIRGSRAVNLSLGSSASADQTILEATGPVLSGNQTFSFTGGTVNDHIFLGNPYCSSVDLATVLDGVRGSGYAENQFRFWDPNFAGNYGVGGYVIYNNGIIAPTTARYSVPTTILQSGQGFMVEAKSTTVNIQFRESDKTASESSVFGKGVKNVSKAAIVNTDPLIRIDLYGNISGGGMYHADGVAVDFNPSYSNTINYEDSKKTWGFQENIGIINLGYALGIEQRKIVYNPLKVDTIALRAYGYKNFSYTLIIPPPAPGGDPDAFPVVYLIDLFNHTSTLVYPRPAPYTIEPLYYQFNTTDDTLSIRNRFIVVYGGIDGSGNGAVITAKNNPYGTVTNPITVGPIPLDPDPLDAAPDLRRELQKYQVCDPDGVPSRHAVLKHQDNMQKQLKPVIKDGFALYPNPAQNFVRLEWKGSEAIIQVTDLSGKVLLDKKVVGQSSATIDCSHYAKGTYFINIKTPEALSIQKFVKQ